MNHYLVLLVQRIRIAHLSCLPLGFTLERISEHFDYEVFAVRSHINLLY